MNQSNILRGARFPGWLKRHATVLKMAGVTLLILLLLIPLGMIRSVLQERLGRRNEAVTEITSSWGREQSIIGPVLVVPYRYAIKSWKEQPAAGGKLEKVELFETAVANAYFLPETLAINGDITPSRLRRGIYQAVVYTGKLALSGQFARPDFGRLRIEEQNVLWDDALITFAIPDLRGVKETLQLQWGTNRHALSPGSKLRGFNSGMYASVGDLRDRLATLPWQLELTLNGSSGINFAPVGAQNSVKLASPWPDPSFRGAFVPTERKVASEGFEATWQVSYYGRDYAQQWTDQDAAVGFDPASAASSLFGVSFLPGIDAYRNVERAIKYGVLFLVLVFAAFFLFEVMSSLRIHPFQYALVGAAFCLFYLGLLSLSEFMPFGLSYLGAAALTTLLIWFYSLKVLHSGKRTFILVGLLAAIYGFLYIALQLQDYSLLFGTAGLFAVLAIVIYITRNIDWYARDLTQPASE
ncbi:MAG: cell envelope integrity protein CreD [Verrucomicrobiota bacterium]